MAEQRHVAACFRGRAARSPAPPLVDWGSGRNRVAADEWPRQRMPAPAHAELQARLPGAGYVRCGLA